MAGRKPSLNVVAEPSEPWVVNTAVVIAIPKAPPSWRTVLNVPDAAPIAAGGTAPMTALCADRHRDTDSGEHEWKNQWRVGQPEFGDQRDPPESQRLQQQPSHHQQPYADPVDELARDRRDDEECRCPRRQQ